MITKKEDLVNTYIKNDFGELRDLYIKKAIELGFAHQYQKDREVDWYDLEFIGICTRWDDGVLGQTDHDDGSLKDCECQKLTLSDLKPRTRTEYEKVTDSIFDLRDEFERGELYFKCPEGGWVQAVHESEVVTFFDDGKLYRKVEKEIDERQEFVKEASKIWNMDDMHCSTDIFREMYDSGKFKFIG